jgi:ABC-type antimicrobial peptide transport system permease subunit
MLQNYIKVTFRNLLKNRIYSIINIAGLSIGITCSILILLWVFDELSFDKFHPKSDRLYQLLVHSDFDNTINTWRSVPLPTYEALKSAHANIKSSAVADWGGDHLLVVEDKKLYLDGYFVSEEFLTMFEFPLLYGNPADVLNDATAIVITEETAQKFFGDDDPINKIIRVDDTGDLKVTGVLKDIPKNSSFQFDYLLAWKYRRASNPWVKENEDNWGNYSFQVFVELSDPAKVEEVNDILKPMLADHGQDDFKSELFLYPLLRWRLYFSFENGIERGGMIDFVKMFSLIAVFILIIACINFMNLATARSESRAREVGIRKSIGSKRTDLMAQFISESLMISLIAYLIAILATVILLPYYNNLVEKDLELSFSTLEFWIFSVGMIFFTGFLAGSYPAFYLSSFLPVKVLKGKISEGKHASLPRKVLVILQFGFSILLIMGTIVIYNQIHLVKNRELGYNKNNLITVERNDELDKNYEVLKNELLQTGIVKGVTVSNSAITHISSNNFVGWPGKPEEQKVIFTTIITEYDYAQTMGIKILHGRDFSRDFPSDSNAIIINKAALDLMALEDPIGTELDLWGEKRTLIGVLDNVLMGSPFYEVKPLFAIMDDWGGYITIRIEETNDISTALDQIRKLFEKYNSTYPFEYSFADLDFDKKFKSINMTSSLSNIFATLALVITGLGLFGLAAFSAEQRTKEIGIRKVMGASVFSIVSLMTWDFSKLVIVAYIISAPLSWWLLRWYLERYPIHTQIHYWVFLVTGVFALAFALIIVTSQTLKAAHANPVNSLRNE